MSVVGVLPRRGRDARKGQEVLATPAVRALAKELGVRLETVKGSGPSGSITSEDLKKVPEERTGCGRQARACREDAFKGTAEDYSAESHDIAEDDSLGHRHG